MWLCLLQVVSLSEDKMSVDLNSDDMLKWKELTQKKQQEYYDSPPIDRLRDCKQSDNSNLKKINAFGFSKTLTSTDKQTKHISKISGIVKKTMKKHGEENIRVSVLFVLAKAGDYYWELPVIKLLIHDTDIQQDINIFIDLSGRVYKNWKDFLKNNTLPKCILCYPKNGVYSAVNGVVEVEYGISPAGKRGRKLLRHLDIGGTVLGVGAAGVGIAGLCFPLALPVVAG